MKYFLFLVVLFLSSLPSFAKWDSNDNWDIEWSRKNYCNGQAKCFEQLKAENINIRDRGDRCNKEIKDCLEVVKIQQQVAHSQYDSNLRQIQANQIQNLQNAIILQQFQINQLQNK